MNQVLASKAHNAFALTAIAALGTLTVPSRSAWADAPIEASTPRATLDTVPETIADFHAGLEGWTLSGNAFSVTSSAQHPNTTGVTGNFLFSYSPSAKAAATGIALSKPFTIDRPFLIFKLAGGSSPKTCVCLTLDGGKTFARVRSGRDDTNMVPMTWNVRSYKGRQAQIEAIDNGDGKSNPCDFIELGDIRLSDKPANSSHTFSGTSSEVALLNRFLDQSCNPGIADRSISAYGVSDDELDVLCTAVTRRMIAQDMDHVPSDSWSPRAKLIKEAVNQIAADKVSDANDLLKERLLIQGLYDWCRTHIVYNQYLVADADRSIKEKHWTAAPLAGMESPNAVCAGYADCLRAMGQSLGLKCWTTNGATRTAFSNVNLKINCPVSEIGGHSWVMFRQQDGFLLPADPTNSTVSLQKARELNGLVSESITLPVTTEDWGLYYSQYYSTAKPWSNDLLPADETGIKMPYSDWASVDTTALRNSYSSKCGMNYFDSAWVNWKV